MPRAKRVTGFALSGLALVCVTWLLWPTEDASVASVGVDPQGGSPQTFARSLQGTVPDGSLRIPSASQPAAPQARLPYAELKRLFDYYLSAVGERDLAAITQQVMAEIDHAMTASQAAAAKQLLGKYLDFKRELVALEQNPALEGTGVQAMRQRFTAMQTLRQRIFSQEEDQGMFGFDDELDRDALARLEISQNPALNAAQKRDQLAVVDANMSAALRADREAPRQVIKVEDMVQKMRANGASDDEVYRMRAKELDPQAASRLAEVDREEQAWKNRIATYLAERSKLLAAHTNASDAERQAALNALQQAQFSADERRRLAAYESLVSD